MHHRITAEELEIRIWLFRSGKLSELRIPLKTDCELGDSKIYLDPTDARTYGQKVCHGSKEAMELAFGTCASDG